MPAEIGGLCKAMSGGGLPGGQTLYERLEKEAERKERP